MAKIKYTPTEYRNMLRMSHSKFLLVEGKNDRRFFQFLLNELFSRTHQDIPRESINIDCAEDLIKVENSYSNRQKVELICSSVQNTALAVKLIGFVDREFREFDMNDVPRDKLTSHNVKDGVVWSRGHSIENYYFDFYTLRDPLRENSDIDHFDQALDLFGKLLNSTLCVACSISLAAKELGKLKQIRKSINWKVVEITSSEVKLKLDDFKQELIRFHRFTEGESKRFIESINEWSKRVDKADITCIRWMCDGHIGFSFMWSVYGQCVLKTCEHIGIERPEAEVQKVLGANDDTRHRACNNCFVRRALDNLTEYPLEVVNFLGLSVPPA